MAYRFVRASAILVQHPGRTRFGCYRALARSATRLTLFGIALTCGLIASGCRRGSETSTGSAKGVAPGKGWTEREASAEFVGSTVCAECHAEVAAAYRGHPMAQSAVPLATTPPIEDYEQKTRFSPPGKRSYWVERDGDQFLHHEIGKSADGKVDFDQAVPVSLAIGSGKRGRSYVLDRDGHLFLSPISWYSKERRWDLSPEYQPENHPRFERPANDRCLLCHAGRVLYADKPTTELAQQYASAVFAEATIGCERCHGAGRQHVETHRAAGRLDGTPTGKGDPTIVQPDHLDNDRRDAVCNQCHLVGEAQFLRYGRRNGDFRPGDLLGDIWAIFISGKSTEGGGEETRAVSHVEQMRASRCFQASERKMGCTSCHDPHSVPEDSRYAEYFDERCLSCHAERGCRLPQEERTAAPEHGSCIACHMPRLAAHDVPHTTQTDHRIRRFGKAGAKGTESSATSSANGGDEPSQWTIFEAREAAIPTWEIDRAWGLLLAQVAEKNRDIDLARQAEAKLKRIRPMVPDDVDVLDGLAVSNLLQGRGDEAVALWDAVLQIEPRRQGVLQSQAIYWQERGEPTRAIGYLEKLIAVNPSLAESHARHARLLAQLGRLDAAVAAAERSLELDPSQATVKGWLTELYRRQGRRE